MKPQPTKRHGAGFSLTEGLVVLTVFGILGSFVLRVFYRDESRAVDAWFAEKAGFSPLWITVPVLLAFGFLRLRSDRRNRRPKRAPLVLPRKR